MIKGLSSVAAILVRRSLQLKCKSFTPDVSSVLKFWHLFSYSNDSTFHSENQILVRRKLYKGKVQLRNTQQM